MREIVYGLVALIVISAIVNYISDNLWTQVALLTIVSIAVVLGIYFAGVYTGVAIAERGASIVLKGQEINDKWDAQKIAGMAQFGKALQVKTDSITAGQQYPQLPPINGGLIISGLEDEQK